jgi:hypothetical protein
MDKPTRNTLRNTVTQCRRLLEGAIGQELAGRFGVYTTGAADDAARMGHLSAEEREYREQLLVHLEHIRASGFKPADAVAQLVREVSFTHLNRLVAYKMMEARGLIREAVSRGAKSQGFLFYLADHPADEALWSGGQSDLAYQHFLTWLGASFADEIPALFSPTDPANRLYPPQRTLDEVLALLNGAELAGIWTEDETIGWVYQYFTPKELRDQARKESQAPRNSYELAFRNQFYTPRYVVEFLSDNTLGRIWYEMCRGQTRLAETCRYLVRRKHPVFMQPGEQPPAPFAGTEDWGDPDLPGEMWTRPNPDLTDLGAIWQYALTVGGYNYARQQLAVECGDLANERRQRYSEAGKWEGGFEELRCCLFFEQRRYRHFGEDPEGEDLAAILALHRAICERWDCETEFIPHRPLKDPREILMLDPACGSLHFGLYCFDLYERIYDEAWELEGILGPAAFSRSDGLLPLRESYPDKEAFLRDVPRLIIERNIHGIDIDPRACQIAALALWLRAQRAYQEMGLKPGERPKITKANVVCAEPMPGERELLDEFSAELDPPVLGQLVAAIFEKMKLAGEAGSLLKIEEELQEVIAQARKQWIEGSPKQLALLPDAVPSEPVQLTIFDLSGIDDEAFWTQAEGRVLDALRSYAEHAAGRASLRRRLFADDAVHGFALIDVCRKRYEVVLINPPFGTPSLGARRYIESEFVDAKTDLLCCFVSRARSMLTPSGCIGTITNRTPLFLSSFARWRVLNMWERDQLRLLADLGSGVLDTAMVETAAYILDQSNLAGLIAFQLTRGVDDRSLALASLVKDVLSETTPQGVYVVDSRDLCRMPHAPASYWIPQRLRQLFQSGKAFESDGRTVERGLFTTDDFRFIRLIWEVQPSLVRFGEKWSYLSKGGSYAPFLGDIHLVVLSEADFAEIKTEVARKYPYLGGNTSWVLHPECRYGRPGLTYPLRTTSDFSPRVLPAGCYWTNKGISLFGPETEEYQLYLLLGVVNSAPFRFLMHSLVGAAEGAAKAYEEGLVARIPFPDLNGLLSTQISSYTRSIVLSLYDAISSDETSPLFSLPPTPFAPRPKRMIDRSLWTAIDGYLAEAYGMDTEDERTVREFFETTEARTGASLESAVEDEEMDDVGGREAAETTDGARSIIDVLSFVMGCSVGRWDVRAAMKPELFPRTPNPFQ